SGAFNVDGRMAALASSFREDLVFFDVAAGTGDIRSQPKDELEAAYDALVCGTRDYVCKCGFRDVVIGLSGGIDSALVAAIAVDALGPQNVLGVSMPGPYSSPGSLADAKKLAENLGIPYQVIPIHAIVESYSTALAGVFAGKKEGVAEENLQARARGNLLMALSNKFGSMVLSTANKSEMAVGYSTLYGDMAGGLAVISDVPKVMVYEVARWINSDYAARKGKKEIIPVSTIDKPPSAELKPNQVDQDTLPPYEILDEILKLYVEENLSGPDIIAK